MKKEINVLIEKFETLSQQCFFKRSSSTHVKKKKKTTIQQIRIYKGNLQFIVKFRKKIKKDEKNMNWIALMGESMIKRG
jgi:hypothetical protein